jgi:hypothetical protein
MMHLLSFVDWLLWITDVLDLLAQPHNLSTKAKKMTNSLMKPVGK